MSALVQDSVAEIRRALATVRYLVAIGRCNDDEVLAACRLVSDCADEIEQVTAPAPELTGGTVRLPVMTLADVVARAAEVTAVTPRGGLLVIEGGRA